ncbi:MAG: phosphoglucomutase/phosphomannomutase family protein [Deltaproteobacteria bacterium]|nr:phosphoglucomutase/phosphomannomutase family protein [Deltaproteobacteria bacterium]MBW1952500.1 phosphoglucomutase/phosphomannomutase family protein [Deltaproteobacteria bacterium]MBW1987551.1 phosphoglucomutase/phosphomannomutase family protein [Deltaproteobacteria bacterium]MBW2135313.1 phosphoglucomutase/phosphomannomutase family protein [Deltaproteobacteria bacterium]
MTAIKFGTSGWRGLLAEDFTFDNVRLVCQAIANYLRKEGLGARGLIISHDTRFLSESFAAAAAEIIAGNGMASYLTTRDAPTPVVTFAIVHDQRDGGINFTASHNPYPYNGLKFSPAWGGPAPNPVTNAIEAIIQEVSHKDIKMLPLSEARRQALVTDIDPRDDYLRDLAAKVDTSILKRAGLKVVVDTLYGTGRGYLDRFLQEAGVTVETLHDWRDPYFGGQQPEPSAEILAELQDRVKTSSANLGLAVDGDADRFGVIDDQGDYHEANEILALLLDYLVETRGWKDGVARSVSTTHLIDRVAAYHGLPVYETPVGFKYLGDFILKNKVTMVAEESEGFSMKGHLPEKDGILADLLVAEMVARKGKDLPQLRDELFARVGPVYTRRINLRLAEEVKQRLLARLTTPPERIAGLAVTQHITIDGHKYILEDGSWLCLRPSGTEPVVRLYLEAHSLEGLEKLKQAGQALVEQV